MKHVNAPQYCSRTRDERRLWVLNDEGLYLWWQRSRCPLDKFMKDNRVQLDELIDRMEAAQ